MKFSIVFDGSGDSLEFAALNSGTYSVLEYYVDQLNNIDSNQFSLMSDHDYINKRIENLTSSITDANKLLATITGDQIEILQSKENYLDQQILNKYHADWVGSQYFQYNIKKFRSNSNLEIANTADILHEMFSDDIGTTTLGTVILKLGQSEIYGKVNLAVHSLEQAFNCIRYSTNNWVEFENIFSKSLVNNDSCNFRLPFNHLGRSLQDKYLNFDNNLEHNDENTFDQMLGFVDISLSRAYTNSYSPEYLAWCKQHNREPSGVYLNIGNIVDLEQRLNDYRLIAYRNISSNNSFSINLNKG